MLSQSTEDLEEIQATLHEQRHRSMEWHRVFMELQVVQFLLECELRGGKTAEKSETEKKGKGPIRETPWYQQRAEAYPVEV